MALRVFDLTAFTRRAKEDRTIVVQGWEIRWTVWVTMLASFFPCLGVAALTFPLIREYFVLVFFALEALCFWAVLGRSRKGLQLRNWQDLRRRYGSLTGQWLVANAPFDPLGNDWRVVRHSAVPNPNRSVRPASAQDSVKDLLDLPVDDRPSGRTKPSEDQELTW